MWLRRAFFYVQFWAIAVLPLWLLISRGVTLNGSGWGLVALLIAAPVLSVALIAVMGLTLARRSVRRARLVSWFDVAFLTAWYATIVIAGLVSHPLIGVLVVVAMLAAFWGAVWQLLAETRQRVSLALARYDSIRVVTH